MRNLAVPSVECFLEISVKFKRARSYFLVLFQTEKSKFLLFIFTPLFILVVFAFKMYNLSRNS